MTTNTNQPATADDNGRGNVDPVDGRKTPMTLDLDHLVAITAFASAQGWLEQLRRFVNSAQYECETVAGWLRVAEREARAV